MLLCTYGKIKLCFFFLSSEHHATPAQPWPRAQAMPCHPYRGPPAQAMPCHPYREPVHRPCHASPTVAPCIGHAMPSLDNFYLHRLFRKLLDLDLFEPDSMQLIKESYEQPQPFFFLLRAKKKRRNYSQRLLQQHTRETCLLSCSVSRIQGSKPCLFGSYGSEGLFIRPFLLVSSWCLLTSCVSYFKL